MESPLLPNKRNKTHSLIFRVLSAVLFLPPFIFLTRTGSIPFLALIAAIALLATWELYRLLRSRGLMHFLPLGLAASTGLVVLLYRGSAEPAILLAVLFFIIVLLALIGRRELSPFSIAAGALFALFYASLLPGYLVLLRELPRHTDISSRYGDGGNFVFLLFLMVWGYDTGAYFTGRALGRRKLAPSISPGKTVEGALGGLAAAVGGAFVAGRFLLPGLDIRNIIILGLITGVLAQAGDLVESMLKREAEIKDSGGWIPGHGGVLDRFDSILLAAPFVYYYIRFAPFGWPGGGS